MSETIGKPAAGDNIDMAVITRGLSKKFFEDYAVQDVTFTIPRGTIFGLIGPSGSGKTTTVRLLTGIYLPTTGELTVLGRDPRRFTAGTRAKIGYMPQLFVMYPDLSIIENMNFAASLYGMGWAHRRKRIDEILKFVELSEHRHKLAKNISGGMQRRLSLAATLVHNPQLLFLDEPTAGIDPVLRKKFWDHFQELKSQDITLLVTTQYVGEAAYCDYIGVMAEGKLLVVDTPEGLRKRAFGGQVINLVSTKPISFETLFAIQNLPYVKGRVHFLGENSVRITVEDASRAIPELIEWCDQNRVPVESIKEFTPPFDDVFIQIVQPEGQNA